MSRTLFLLLLIIMASGVSGQKISPDKFSLPRRMLPLEKLLIELNKAGAELSYRPDQIPKIAMKPPGGRRTVSGWLTILLRDTELTFANTGVGYLIFPDPELSNRQFTIYGTITDARSGERLIAAAVRDSLARGGTLSNEYGLYTLTAPGGRRRIQFSYVGYAPRKLEFVLSRDTTLNVRLQPAGDLPEIIVTPTPDGVNEAHLLETRTSVTRTQTDQVGGPGGVADPLRVARLLAGVETGADGLGGIFIRGSEAGHNLVLLDGVPLYNLSHAAGLLSIFNNEAIRRMDIYKDGLPARFGGRIGGVLDVHTRDGNYYTYETTLGADLLTVNLTAEGPIKAGKSSFLISGRNFWGRELLGRLSERSKENAGRTGRMDYQVYDFNVKLNQRVGRKGHLYLSLFNGKDDYRNDSYRDDFPTVLTSGGAVFPYKSSVFNQELVRWGNSVGALRYNHVFNDRFFGNFRLSYSDLLVDVAYERADSLIERFDEYEANVDVRSGRYGSDIQQVGAAFDGQLDIPRKGMVRFGGELNLHRFLPQLLSESRPLASLPSLSSLGDDEVMRPVQLSAYGSYTGRWREVRFRFGLRGQWYRNETDFLHLSPRALVAGKVGERTGWRVTYDRSVQPLHLISSTVIGLPSDLWVPATREFGPSTSGQVAAQLTYQLGNDWNLVGAVYSRTIRNLANFTEDGINWRQNLSAGAGEAKGLELTLNRTRGKFSGWGSYTYASSTRDFDDLINLGRPFNFRYSRRHSFKSLLRYQSGRNVSLTAHFRFGSGGYYSLSEVTLQLADPAEPDNTDPIIIDITQEKNGIQLPANHRLDVNAHFSFGSSNNPLISHNLSLGIYNVYGRRNPILYEVESNYIVVDENLRNNRRVKQIFVPGFLPALSYKLRFRSLPQR